MNFLFSLKKKRKALALVKGDGRGRKGKSHVLGDHGRDQQGESRESHIGDLFKFPDRV